MLNSRHRSSTLPRLHQKHESAASGSLLARGGSFIKTTSLSSRVVATSKSGWNAGLGPNGHDGLFVDSVYVDCVQHCQQEPTRSLGGADLGYHQRLQFKFHAAFPLSVLIFGVVAVHVGLGQLVQLLGH